MTMDGVLEALRRSAYHGFMDKNPIVATVQFCSIGKC